MHPETESVAPEPTPWTRAGVILLRLALLVFLAWALVSGRIPAEAPVAEDASSLGTSGRTAAEPVAGDLDRAG